MALLSFIRIRRKKFIITEIENGNAEKQLSRKMFSRREITGKGSK